MQQLLVEAPLLIVSPVACELCAAKQRPKRCRVRLPKQRLTVELQSALPGWMLRWAATCSL